MCQIVRTSTRNNENGKNDGTDRYSVRPWNHRMFKVTGRAEKFVISDFELIDMRRPCGGITVAPGLRPFLLGTSRSAQTAPTVRLIDPYNLINSA